MQKLFIQTPSVGVFECSSVVLFEYREVSLKSFFRRLRCVFSQPSFLQIRLKNSFQLELLFRMSNKHSGLLSSVSSLEPFLPCSLVFNPFSHFAAITHGQDALFSFVRISPPSRFALEFSFRCRISCHSVYHFSQYRSAKCLTSQIGQLVPAAERLRSLRITGTKKRGGEEIFTAPRRYKN